MTSPANTEDVGTLIARLREAKDGRDAAKDRYDTALSDLLIAEQQYQHALKDWERAGPFAKLFNPEARRQA